MLNQYIFKISLIKWTINGYIYKIVLLPAPKNTGQMNTVVIGWKHCSNRGIIHALKVISSEIGATM